MCATPAVPIPIAAGDDQFHVAYMRHTGEWHVVHRDITLPRALAAVRDDPYFLI
jgi:hypothetical protein